MAYMPKKGISFVYLTTAPRVRPPERAEGVCRGSVCSGYCRNGYASPMYSS